jgi:streptogramin lyase
LTGKECCVRNKPIFSVLFSLAVLLATPALACRPFGSYQLVEDKTGGIWFTEGDNNAVSRLAPDGSVKAYPLPTKNAEPSALTLDRRGNVWFVEMDGGKIGRLAPNGRVQEFPTRDGHPGMVAVDRRGEAWFTQMSGHENASDEHAGHGSAMVAKVARIDRQEKVHDFPLREGWPTSLAFDRQDRAWVTILVPGRNGDQPKGRLARLSRDGQWTTEAAWENSCPSNLTPVAGGLAFSDHCRFVLGRIAAGELTEQKLPDGTYIQQMSAAPDGVLWFSGDQRGRLGRIAPDGAVAYLPERPGSDDQIMAVKVLRNGEVVFSEFYNYNINRRTRSGEYVEHLVNIEERQGSREVRDGEVCYVQFAARIAGKAEMDRKRAEEVRSGRFKPDGAGTEKLVEQKCLACHDARRLLLSRRSDWTPSLSRMHSYRQLRGIAPLTPEETSQLVRYFNKYYGLGRQSESSREVGSMMR